MVRNEIGKGSEKLVATLARENVWDSQGEEISEYRRQYFAKKFLPGLRSFPGIRELFERVRVTQAARSPWQHRR